MLRIVPLIPVDTVSLVPSVGGLAIGGAIVVSLLACSILRNQEAAATENVYVIASRPDGFPDRVVFSRLEMGTV